MREINQSEMSLVCGGFLPAVVTAAGAAVRPYAAGAATNMLVYSAYQIYDEKPITGNGLAISAGTGAVGGLASVIGKASGSAVGNALWQANFLPITIAGDAIAANK